MLKLSAILFVLHNNNIQCLLFCYVKLNSYLNPKLFLVVLNSTYFISKTLSKTTMRTKVLKKEIHTTQIHTIYNALLKAKENKYIF